MQDAKKDTQALREVKYAYTKKNDFSSEVNRAILEKFLNFRAKGIKCFGLLKTMFCSWANGRNSYFSVI